MDGSGHRAEAERWLYTADKLLSARDLHGARSFAVRARESDPTFDVTELLITVIDTLLAGENLINNQRDWYGILQILRYTQNVEFIATQYHKLALLLDPTRNRFAFSGHAFSLVHEAWSVLSNPIKKALYDNELRLATDPRPAPPPDLFPPQPQTNLNPNPNPNPDPARPPPQKPQRQTPGRRGRRPNDRKVVVEEERSFLPSLNNATPEPSARASDPTRPAETVVGSSSTVFWTACPYCYFMYEYQNVYKDCTLKCQSCGRAFHAVAVPAPPVTEKDAYFCCWGLFPLGFSSDFKELSGGSSKWNPFTSMFACPLQKASNKRTPSMKGPWVYYNDEAAAAFVELSDSTEDDSDVDWRNPGKRNKKAKQARRRRFRGSNIRRAIMNRVDRPRRGNHSGSGNSNMENGEVLEASGSGVAPKAIARAESSKKAALSSSRKRGAADLGNLDLNVEFSNNEAEEPAPSAPIVHAGNRAGNGEEDNIEGISFFEGLDEFLNSLPILNVVADNDKVKGH